MNKIYLVTRPEHDDTTFYLSSWSKETIAIAEKRGIKVLDLHQEKVNKKEVESRLRKFSPKLVVFNGHGDENTITGHKNEPLVSAGNNDELLREKIIFAISCRSGKNLGTTSVQRGAIGFVGYADDFIFSYEPDNMSRPLADKTARLFLEPQQKFVEALLKGNTMKESCTRIEKAMKENIIKLLTSNSQDTQLAKYLWWDLRNFVAHGNMDAVF